MSYSNISFGSLAFRHEDTEAKHIKVSSSHIINDRISIENAKSLKDYLGRILDKHMDTKFNWTRIFSGSGDQYGFGREKYMDVDRDMALIKTSEGWSAFAGIGLTRIESLKMFPSKDEAEEWLEIIDKNRAALKEMFTYTSQVKNEKS